MNQLPSQGQTGSASNVPANPLGTLPINQLLARFAIPSIIAMLVSALYNIVDQFLSAAVWECLEMLLPMLHFL